MPSRSRIKDFLWRHSAGIAFTAMLLFVATIGLVGWTYILITRKFDTARRWDLPSRVYSDATPILPGMTYPRSLLEAKLNHVGYHESRGPVSNPGEYRYVGRNLELYLQNFEYPDMEFRATKVLVEFDGSVVERVKRIDDGITLRGVRIEPELITSIYNNEMEDRVTVPLAAVPRVVQDAIIATEDKSFHQHEGISIRGIAGALVKDIRQGAWTHGGSTLTQQLVKNLYLNPERTWRRKGVEAVMSLMVEARYSKNEILESYMNEIYLGQNGSVQIIGVQQASQVYFGKQVTYLTLGEAATLAGMIRSPNVLNPLKYPDRAKSRRDTVLGLMKEQGMISEAEFEAAAAAPLAVTKFPRTSRSAPFFVDFVMRQLKEKYPETQLKTEGLRIFTTLDTIMQRSAESALESGTSDLRKRYSSIRKSSSPLEGVVVTIQPGTGYVKALVGGRSYSKTQFNRAIQARRQPGSLFKPFVYATAMEPARGQQALTAGTVLEDSPISVPSGTGLWEPQNYDLRYHGRVSVRTALAHSYNVPAVRAALDAGMPNVVRTASTIGIESHLAPYPSISLGSFEVTPLEIAFAYSAFANLGVKAEPISILAVVDHDGRLVESRQVKMKRVASAAVSYIINDMLQDVLDYGTAGRIRTLGFDRPFAGKTGTTSNYRDAWFVGYSPRILTLVWVGFDDNTPLRLTGGDACVPIWTAYMNRIAGLVADVDWNPPDDVVDAIIDPMTGRLATPNCPDERTEIYVRGTEPIDACPLHASYADGLPYMRDVSPTYDRADATPMQPVPAPTTEQQRKPKPRGLKRLIGIILGNGQ